MPRTELIIVLLQACKPSIPLQILIEAPYLNANEGQHLVRATQHALDDLNEFSAHHLRLRLGKHITAGNGSTASLAPVDSVHSGRELQNDDESEDVALTIEMSPKSGSTPSSAELRPHSTVLDVAYALNQVPSTSSSSSTLANIIATKLQEIFAEEQAIIAHILTSSQPAGNAQPSQGSSSPMSPSSSISVREQRNSPGRKLHKDLAAKLDRRMTRTLKYAPEYHITISLFASGANPSSWDIESAIYEHFSPLLESFSDISNFTVDTQVQLYASFAPSVQSPEYDSTRNVWTLKNEDLSGFINAAEWPLSPSIGAGPTLNFVFYVPNEDVSPLVVRDSLATSWLIPQWGGVSILNPPKPTSESFKHPSFLSKELIQPGLLTFSHQLLTLLGAPQLPASLPLQLQTLTRVQATSLLLSASSTMGSLARLTVALPSIAIPESVAEAVDRTLSQLRSTCTDLQDGKFKSALNHARIAEAEAEKGFFEKSMVGQVYFPDEHKVAVYLPLLGPIGVPLIMNAIKEVRRLLVVWKASKS